MTRFKWDCDACGRPVRDDDGYIAVDHLEAGGLRDMWAAWEQANTARRAAQESPVMTAAEVPPFRVVRWQVLHRACDPRPDAADYWIGVERFRTLGDLLHWNRHLHEKNWLRHTDWDAFIERRLR